LFLSSFVRGSIVPLRTWQHCSSHPGYVARYVSMLALYSMIVRCHHFVMSWWVVFSEIICPIFSSTFPIYFLCSKILVSLSNLSCSKILAPLYVNYVELFFTSYYPHISHKDHHITYIIINTPFIPSTSHHVTINTPYILSTTLIFNAKHILLR